VLQSRLTWHDAPPLAPKITSRFLTEFLARRLPILSQFLLIRAPPSPTTIPPTPVAQVALEVEAFYEAVSVKVR
jgi:hypothetical protein